MCGINGIFNYRDGAPPLRERELILTRDAMAARGPDGAELWMGKRGDVGLAHRRLSIIDLSERGAQPMWDAGRTCVIVFNGEIYNHQELRHKLESRGHRFLSDTDTEVILNLYKEKGTRLFEDLRGMYAFALFDEQAGRLLLGRDPFGIKPLYYQDDGKTLRFASQVKALLRSQSTPELEPAGVVGFLTWGHVPEPWTPYRGLVSLPAGHGLEVSRGGSPRLFLHSDIGKLDGVASGASSVADVRPTLKALLLDSVEKHNVADVPVGVFLSAGQDSSTLTALVRERFADKEIRTVCVGFEELRGTAYDETAIAEITARRYRTAHQTVWIGRRDFDDHLGRILEAMDLPSVDGINTYFVSRAAADLGLKVALSGVGGDELFAGYSSFREIPAMVSWMRRLPISAGMRRGCTSLARSWLPRGVSPKYAGLAEYGGTVAGAFFLRRALFMPWELPGILGPELAREGWERLAVMKSLEASYDKTASGTWTIAMLEIRHYLQSRLLRDADWAGMAHSLEIRTPLVDFEVLRGFERHGLAGRVTKADLAALPAESLPAEVLQRGKTGFHTPVQQWLEHSGLLEKRERGHRGWARYLLRHFGLVSPPVAKAARAHATLATTPSTAKPTPPSAKRILIYRLGSLGDTVVALPCFHLIERFFPCSERRVLTIYPEHQAASPMDAVLGGTGLVHGYLRYPVKTRHPAEFLRLIRAIRAWNPDALVYLTEYRGFWNTLRDGLFFKLCCGIPRVFGLPWTPQIRQHRLKSHGVHESETERLVHKLGGAMGPIDLDSRAAWDLRLSPAELAKADAALKAWPAPARFIACGVGTKVPLKDWGLANWRELLARLGRKWPAVGLVMVGAEGEAALNEEARRVWPGPSLNLCGRLNPRESCALLGRAAFFLGHDSGPMHLAAAAGTPCVAVFTARAKPGVWFPYGRGHHPLYHRTPCADCRLEVCRYGHRLCITSITVEEVLLEINKLEAALSGGA